VLTGEQLLRNSHEVFHALGVDPAGPSYGEDDGGVAAQIVARFPEHLHAALSDLAGATAYETHILRQFRSEERPPAD